MRSWKKALIALLILPALLSTLPAAVSADFGPKPRITVQVENPPPGAYCLDLLVPYDKPYENTGGDTDDPVMRAGLFSLTGQGWYPALANGTGMPLFGKLTGEPDGDRMIHVFSYFGVPDRFRIIIATPDGRTVVSEAMDRSSFEYQVVFDYATGRATRQTLAAAYGLQLAGTFAATIVIEGLILLLFRFPLKKNGMVFLLANLGTQILLAAALGYALVSMGSMAAILAAIPAEAAVIVIESLVYARWLRPQRKNRAVAYALVANLASAAAGLMLF